MLVLTLYCMNVEVRARGHSRNTLLAMSCDWDAVQCCSFPSSCCQLLVVLAVSKNGDTVYLSTALDHEQILDAQSPDKHSGGALMRTHTLLCHMNRCGTEMWAIQFENAPFAGLAPDNGMQCACPLFPFQVACCVCLAAPRWSSSHVSLLVISE